jgi:hypothetical protein
MRGVLLYCRLLRFFPALMGGPEKTSIPDITGEGTAIVPFDLVYLLVIVITGEGGAD